MYTNELLLTGALRQQLDLSLYDFFLFFFHEPWNDERLLLFFFTYLYRLCYRNVIAAPTADNGLPFASTWATPQGMAQPGSQHWPPL